MFKKEKSEFEKEKEKAQKKLLKKAKKIKKLEDLKRKQAEKILDKEYVQRRLAIERKRDEKKAALRDGYIAKVEQEVLADEKETFTCKICGEEIGLGNMQCPHCGQMYCPFCGYLLDDKKFTGICPRCKGYVAGGVTPAKLVITTVEDIPEEDRFWEQLDECPKCGGAIQPDWDECPLCGQKLERKKEAAPQAEEKTIASLKEKRKQELLKKRRQQAAPKRGI
ncbi:MAG: hypothetical protein ACP6IY_02745 [Promethearchaeia archaeon]